MKDTGVTSLTITSTVRTPKDQARIMYTNISKLGVEHQKALYGPNGDKAIDLYSKLKKEGKSSDEIKNAMEDLILKLGPPSFSRHLSDPSEYSVFDIAPSSVKDSLEATFEKNLNLNKQKGVLFNYFSPRKGKDPAFHLEVKLK